MNALLHRFGLLLVMISTSATASLQAAEAPSILWVIAEDLGPAFSCYGNKAITTPNLDRLASEGVRYSRAYTTAPVCSASRSAFMTGMYQTTIGAQNHRSHRGDGFTLPEGVKVVPEWLTEAGYFCTNLTDLPASFGFRGTGKTDWNFDSRGTGFQTGSWEELPARRPFLGQINLSETHRPYKGPRRVDPAAVTLPPYYPDHPVAREDYAAYLNDVLALDAKIGIILAAVERAGLADETIVLFMADHGESHVRGKQFVYEEGLHIPLIIRWPKNFPAPRQITPGKVDGRLIEAIDIAPTLLWAAGLPKPPKMQGRIFLGDDADPDRTRTFGARDRCDETVFRLRSVRDDRYRYIHNFTPERPFLQTNAYKERSYPVWTLLQELHAQGKLTPEQEFLCGSSMPEEELYDLVEDPHEIRNLAQSDAPEHQAAVRRLREAVDRWIEETDDQGRVFETPETIKEQTDRSKKAKDKKRAEEQRGSPQRP